MRPSISGHPTCEPPAVTHAPLGIQYYWSNTGVSPHVDHAQLEYQLDIIDFWKCIMSSSAEHPPRYDQKESNGWPSNADHITQETTYKSSSPLPPLSTSYHRL